MSNKDKMMHASVADVKWNAPKVVDTARKRITKSWTLSTRSWTLAM